MSKQLFVQSVKGLILSFSIWKCFSVICVEIKLIFFRKGLQGDFFEAEDVGDIKVPSRFFYFFTYVMFEHWLGDGG